MATGKSTTWKAILNQLKSPLAPELIKFRSGGGGMMLGYIDARDVMKRLDDVMGAENWQDEYKEVNGGIICTLKLRNGEDGEWISKSNGSSFTKIESVKGGISGALKRAAVEWGIGRYLYYLDPKKYNSNNIDQWPDAFKPWEVENWEDVTTFDAELDKEITNDIGMDEELYVEAVQSVTDKALAIDHAVTLTELNAVVIMLTEQEERILGDAIANKTSELARQENEVAKASRKS